MKEIKRVAALDFELFNTRHYWSVCWAGIILCDEKFENVREIELKMNPGIKKKFVGKCMNFPYEYDFFADSPNFKQCYQTFFGAVDGALVVGHAVENDLRMLLDACKRYGLTPPSFDFIDTNVCFGEVSKCNAQLSLTAMAAQFDIEFTAHNPVEDARATLAIVKALSKGDLRGFLSGNGIVCGRLENGLIRRSYSPVMSEKQQKRIKNYNRVFAAAQSLGQGKGKRYHFVPSISCEQDLTEVAQRLLGRGDALCHDIYCADIVVTQNAQSADKKETSFKKLVAELGLPLKNYKFPRPQRKRAEAKSPTASSVSGIDRT